MKTKISDSTCVAQSKSHTHTHTQCDLNNSKSFTVQIDNNKPYIIKTDNLFIANENCLKFLDSIPDNSVDLIVTDPPFAINESKFDDKYYCRKSTKVVNGYVEAPKNISYEDWCYSWINKINRILKPNGSMYIFSGWNNVADMEYAIRRTNHFRVINHLIWKYNFGVYTSQKYVSSHYHILYCCKNDGKPYFNKYAYHNEQHSIGSGSAIYNDLQDVIVINREYKPNTIKNCNQLPSKLVEKLIKHSSKKGDVVLDIFSGGFTTEFAALKLHRKAWGCELNKVSCNIFFPKLIDFKDFYKTKADIIGFSRSGKLSNQGKPITEDVKLNIQKFFQSLDGHKKEKICKTAEYFKRGKFSISRIINSISE